MKNSRAVVMIGLSLVAGVAAVVVSSRWLAQQTLAGTDQVIVAARDIEVGTPLNASLAEVVRWPRGSLPAGAIADPKLIETRVLKATLLRGEPILESKLAVPGEKGGLSAALGQGKRAITVKVNEVIGVAGFALPGSYVDVLVSTKDDNDKAVSKTVLQRILVLAVAQEASRDETKPKVVSAVTLEVTPEQAERLDLARSVGTLSLALRSHIDKDAVATAGVRKPDLLKMSSAPEPAPKAAPARRQAAPRAKASGPAKEVSVKDKVEVIRGVQKSVSAL